MWWTMQILTKVKITAVLFSRLYIRDTALFFSGSLPWSSHTFFVFFRGLEKEEKNEMSPPNTLIRNDWMKLTLLEGWNQGCDHSLFQAAPNAHLLYINKQKYY